MRIAAFSAAWLALAATAHAACPAQVDRAQLALDYGAFDAAGWRNLLGQGCTDAAVALLAAYRETNAERLSAAQRSELDFHIGQSLAFADRNAEAVLHFERAAAEPGSEEWSAYVAATIAFLRGDAAALAVARTRYASAPNASAMRLRFVDGLIACPGRPYMQAVHCAATPQAPRSR
jgi:hypothetical protein